MTKKKRSAARVALRMLSAGWPADVVAGYLYLRTLVEADISVEEAGGFHGLPLTLVKSP